MKIILSLLLLYISLYANIGTIMLLKGEATIKRGTIVLDAKMGDTIEEGDQLDTYRVSKLQLIFNDDTIVTLGANTKYIVNAYNDSNDLHMKMTLKRGFLKTITGHIGKLAPSRFKLKTKSATIGVRGTGWKTFVGANIENSVCFKGEITITTPTKFFELPAGNMILMSDGKAKKFKTDMKFFNKQIAKVQKKQKTKIKLKTKEKVKSKTKLKIKTKEKIKTVVTKEKVSKVKDETSKPKISKSETVKTQVSKVKIKVEPTIKAEPTIKVEPIKIEEPSIDNSYIQTDDIIENPVENPIENIENNDIKVATEIILDTVQKQIQKSTIIISPSILLPTVKEYEPTPSNGP